MKFIILVIIIIGSYQNKSYTQELYKKDNKITLKDIDTINFKDKNSLKQGWWIFESNNDLIKLRHLNNDTLDGITKVYRKKDLKLLSIGEYKKGLLSGRYTEYDYRGNINLEMYYINDTLNGLWKRYIGGRLVEEMNFLKGKRNGQRKRYGKNGVSLIDNYNDDRLAGSYKSYYRNGKLKIEADFQNLSPMKIYSKRGHLKEVRIFDDKGNYLKTIYYDKKENIKREKFKK